jgi:ketosteroid isomerase-like protein
MGHANEQLLRDAYAIFAKGDVAGFLAVCTDDIVFRVPGHNVMSGDWDREGFAGEFVQRLMGHTQGTFREEIVDLVANEDHGVLLLDHHFERDGKPVDYRTCHVVELRNGKITSWREWPGDLAKFEEAWTA